MFRRCARFPFGPFALVIAAGCGIEGTWVCCDAQSADAGRHYSLAKVTFNPDTSFEAEGKMNGRVVKAAGTYHYNCCKEKLTLHTGGKELVYDVRVKCNKKLRFRKELEDGTEMTVTMRRFHSCPDRATCKPCLTAHRKYRQCFDGELTPGAAQGAGASSATACACTNR